MEPPKYVAGFRVDFELDLAESIQRHDLGTCLHRNRYNLNESKSCRIVSLSKQTSIDAAEDDEEAAAFLLSHFKQLKETCDTADVANSTVEKTANVEQFNSRILSLTAAQTDTETAVKSPSNTATTTTAAAAATATATATATTNNATDVIPTAPTPPTVTDELKPNQEEEEEEDTDEAEEDTPIPTIPIQPTEVVSEMCLMSNDGVKKWSSVTEFLTNCSWESSGDPACNNCNEQLTSVLNIETVVRATVRCGDCDEYYCRVCFDSIHSGGKRKLHSIIWENGIHLVDETMSAVLKVEEEEVV